MFDQAGRAIAAPNIATLADRWSRHRAAFIPALLEAAAAITRRIPGTAPAGRS